MTLSNHNPKFFLASAFLMAVPLLAQTQSMVTTVQSFTLERTVSLNNVLSTATPNLPATVAGGVVSGALELRERMVYDQTSMTLTYTLFSVASGSPNPTPTGTDVTGTTYATYWSGPTF